MAGTWRTPSNKCGKGHTSTFPTKYQTVVVKNEEKKGFSTQTKRFFHISVNENPGPGSYLSHTSAEIYSPSFSKKGTGGFPSKAPRVPRNRRRRSVPGPNTYNLQSSLLHKPGFGRRSSRVFCLPVAVKADKSTNTTPAPNQYNVSYREVQQNTVVPAHSVFLSKSRRSPGFSTPLKGPSPCHYEVNDAVTQKNPQVPFSSFKSSTSRFLFSGKNLGPGPAAYNLDQPAEPAKRTVLPRRRYLVLSAPPLKLPKTPPFPGPGHYDIVDYKDPPKHFMSSAVFLSGTSRWTQEAKGTSVPGPGSYDPEIAPKRPFLLKDEKYLQRMAERYLS
ncbi:O(6)-methylguanine-induced apoptosis 2 [Denticeps clupeoides]|uniref:O(6)-methylguanine-induced apoptosis 2 n=1 Tax=Denticeps clupeoides TaxID=299321 RepID=UPI0010A3EAF5|nr:O(6)-methylguanine-induced apoptosis 2 [Denticeps clupeoides]